MDFSELEGIEIEGTQEKKKKGVVDIIFVMDTSGSMGPAIAEVGKNIGTFVENLDPTTIKDWRAKVYSFSDLETDSPEISLNVSRPWVAEPQGIVNQMVECIDLVRQMGGGDEPESSLDAMYLAARDGFDSDWTERTRVIVLFTDATPKPIMKETLGVDADGNVLLSQMLNDSHTYVHLFAPKNDQYSNLKQGAGKFFNYSPIDQEGVSLVEALKNVDFTKTLETLGKSVSQASLIS